VEKVETISKPEWKPRKQCPRDGTWRHGQSQFDERGKGRGESVSMREGGRNSVRKKEGSNPQVR
jgi:hypothetical protein